jgi:hypothetical protein
MLQVKSVFASDCTFKHTIQINEAHLFNNVVFKIQCILIVEGLNLLGVHYP